MSRYQPELIGRRVRLDADTGDQWTHVAVGDEGTINFVDAVGTLHVKWDSGSSLGLIPCVDRFTILGPDPMDAIDPIEADA